MVALGGVVVDHVEDDLDAGGVEGLHHLLELRHLLAPVAVAGVEVVRGQVGDRVVPPVVAQPQLDQAAVVHELVHRHELDRGDAQGLEVLDDGIADQARIGAALLLGHVGVAHGEAPDVRLVHQRLVPRHPRRPVVAPVEVRVGHHRLGHERGTVGVVGGPTGTRVEAIVEDGVVPLDGAVHGLGVGVDQELGRVGPQALVGFPRAVHPEAVALSGLHPRGVAVVDEGRDLGQVVAVLHAGVIEQAQLDALGGLREHREVGAVPVEGGPEGEGLAWPQIHGGRV